MTTRARKKAEDALLLALACGATVEGAARRAGVSERTAYRRLAEPGFQQRLQGLRADMLERTTGALTAAGAEAVRTLLELLKSSSSDSVRLAAARAVLEVGQKLREATELEERLTTLEQGLLRDGGGRSAARAGASRCRGAPRGCESEVLSTPDTDRPPGA